MNPGELDRRITIQEKTTSTSANSGDVESSWSDKWTLWAKLEDYLVGGEDFEGKRRVSGKRPVYVIRRKAINESDFRLKDESGDVFNIEEVRELFDEYRDQYQKIICEREV